MAGTNETAQKILESAQGAESVTTDGTTVKRVPISQQIEAAKFAAASRPRKRGLHGVRIVPIRQVPGC